MGKLYKDVDLIEPFQVTFDNRTFDAYANEDDAITIDSTSYLRVKDSTGRSVKAVMPDGKAHQLIVMLNEGSAGYLCYIEGEGAEAAAISTTIQVIDGVVPPEPDYIIDYFRDHQGGFTYSTLPYESQISPEWDWDMTFELDPTESTEYTDNISAIYSMNPQIVLLTCAQGPLKINGTTIGRVDFDPTEIRTYVNEFTISKSGSYTVVIRNKATREDTTLTGTVSGDISGIVNGLTPAQVASNLHYAPTDLRIIARLNIYSS